jgi:competence protein ComEA
MLLARQEKPAPSNDKGKATMERLCQSCHELDLVTGTRRTEIGWQSSVDEMAGKGAEGTDQEFAEVVQYLTRNFGKLNVNTATPQQLQEFLGLTEKEAKSVVAFREHNGDFKNFEQLQAVPEVDGGKLQAKRSLIAFTL